MGSPDQEEPHGLPAVVRAATTGVAVTEGRSPGEESSIPAWDAESLSETFQEKSIRLRSMERPLRLVAILAMAGVVLAALLVGMRDLPLARETVGLRFGLTSEVSTPLLIMCVILQAGAWSLLLMGAMHAHWPVRVISVGLWSAAMTVYGATPLFTSTHGTPWAAAVLIVILAAWTLSAVVWLVDRSRIRVGGETHRQRLQLLTGAGCLVLTLLIYVVGWLPDPGISGLARASSEQQLFVQGGILIPTVFLTGSDFTEWAEVTAGRFGT
ncbi:MAG: hypothetical protein J2P45_27195, partial [Candidatus Dormibacteraeota bacterium]|nr:hypothetical protein [Candidatus Dormibacteraeota bacterium]